jgi:ERCC4-type nuclease
MKNLWLFKKLNDSNTIFEKTTLQIGDYQLINDDTKETICVERKIISDFVSSVYDGRCEKELLLQEMFSRSRNKNVKHWYGP